MKTEVRSEGRVDFHAVLRWVRLVGVMPCVLFWGVSLAWSAESGPGAAGSEGIRFTAIVAEPLQPGRNLLSNPGFEATQDHGIPAGWNWDRRNTDAVCLADRSQAHRGSRSIFLTNGTPFGAHVYGMLWRAQPVRLEEGKSYTMSAWVKSEAPGNASLIGGRDWQVRLPVPATGGQWRRIAKSFKPGPQDCDFVLRINTESPTCGVWMDDVKLEEGTSPTVDADAAGNANRLLLEPDDLDTAVQGEGAFSVAFTLVNSRPVAGTWSMTLGSGGPLRQPADLGVGAWRVRVKGDASSAHDAPRVMALRLEEPGREQAVAHATVRFYSATNALNRLAGLRNQWSALQTDLRTLQARGQDTSYPRVTATVLGNFLGYAEEDARRGEVKRALEQVRDLESMAERLSRELAEGLAGQRHFPAVPRWTGDKRPVVKSSSFLASVRMPGGATADRPIFFNGYGHFGQVVSDMEKWPDYGANIIQIEVGPSAIFPAQGQTNQAPIRALLKTLDRARQSGVAVCLLISPHYLPDWTRARWPHLRKHREGFLQYCLHAPEGQDLLRRFLATLLPPVKDHPALHSICLSNEPVNEEEPCEPARRLWQAWLEKRHGTLAAANAGLGSNFTSFAQIPLPDPFGPRPARPLWSDYIRFNQEFFADWHKQMADFIHETAPGLPVHAKAMTWTMLQDGDLKYGVEATLFGRFSDINGNDSANWFDFDGAEFAQQWQLNAMGHDLQRSVLDAPVFNTENHIILDRETRYVPAAHVRAALWQAAAHGQSATAIWVWERTFDAKSDFAGSIMHRPACAEAVGLLNHDLNRAALEMSAIQQAPPRVLVVHSVTAGLWEGSRYTECLSKLYTALSFTGLKIGFITERQLEAGVVPDAPVVFVPEIVHFSDAALASLARFKGRIVLIGEGDLLTRDEIGRPRASSLPGEKLNLPHGSTSAQTLHTELLARFPAWNLHPAVELRAADQKPVWGVEWRTAQTRDGLVVNLCNYLKASVAVSPPGRPKVARDVLSGATVEWPLTLAPLEVRLLQLESP